MKPDNGGWPKIPTGALDTAQVLDPAHRGYRMWRLCSGFHQIRILCHAYHSDAA